MPVTPELTVSSAVQGFLAHCRLRYLSKNTLRAYQSDLTQFAERAGLDAPISQINRPEIRRHLQMLHEAGSSDKSTQRKLAVVKELCKWLHGQRLLDASALLTLMGPRRRFPLPDVPSETDITRLLEGEMPGPCPARDRAILELLYGAGLRVAELVAIDLKDFKDSRVLLVHGKGEKERLVVFGECAQQAIEAWLPIRKALLEKAEMQTDALFFRCRLENAAVRSAVTRALAEPDAPSQTDLSTRLGVTQGWISQVHKKVSAGVILPRQKAPVRLDVRSVGRIVKRVAVANKLPPYNVHLLRHACATHMHDHNMPLQAIAVLLGHQRFSSAQIYTRVSTGRMLDVYRRAHPHAGKST